jgi:hypothetical protein
MLVIKPICGLANRLRVIDSAISLADIYKKDLTIIWESSYELNCRFGKLFNLSDKFRLIEKTAGPIKMRILKRLPEAMHLIGINYPPAYDRVLTDKEIKILKKTGDDFSFCSSLRKVYIQSCHHFYGSAYSFKWLKPVKAIEEIVGNYTTLFDNNTVGIHIRRSDNLKSIAHSPVDEFIISMKSELDAVNDCKFFLATDSAEEESKLKRIFGSRIITHKKVLSRNSEQGIIDATIDLLCLASTRKVIGSYFSSFSAVASLIKGIELKLVYR